MIKLRRESGGLEPKRQGNPGRGKLSGLGDWARARLAGKGDLTLDELRLELEQVHGVKVHRSSVGGWLHRLGLSHKKTLCAAEQQRPDVALARDICISRRLPFMSKALEGLAFAKLKALIRKAAARSYDALWQAVGTVCDIFSDEECYNYFKAAGYEAD